MFPWGSEQRPIIVRTNSHEKGRKIIQICDRYGMHYIMGVEAVEDLSDLKRALIERLAPANAYDPCPCGSGKKYKFCCMSKMKNFDLDQLIADFAEE